MGWPPTLVAHRRAMAPTSSLPIFTRFYVSVKHSNCQQDGEKWAIPDAISQRVTSRALHLKPPIATPSSARCSWLLFPQHTYYVAILRWAGVALGFPLVLRVCVSPHRVCISPKDLGTVDCDSDMHHQKITLCYTTFQTPFSPTHRFVALPPCLWMAGRVGPESIREFIGLTQTAE